MKYQQIPDVSSQSSVCIASYLMTMWVMAVKSTCASTVTLASGREATSMASARLGYVRKLGSSFVDWEVIANEENNGWLAGRR